MLPISDVIPSRTRPYVTLGLIGASALVFLYQLHLDPHHLFDLTHEFGATPADLRWSQPITSAFLHTGWIQLAGNMLYLWIFGRTVEHVMGPAAFLGFYLSAAMVGALAHAGLHPTSVTPLLGSSSAVAALLATYFLLFPTSKILSVVFLIVSIELVEVPAVFFIPAWLVLQVLGGVHAAVPHAADAVMAIGAHAAASVLGLAVGGFLKWRGWKWELEAR